MEDGPGAAAAAGKGKEGSQIGGSASGQGDPGGGGGSGAPPVFLWPGAPATGSLAAFLAAAGPCPGAVGGAWPGAPGAAPPGGVVEGGSPLGLAAGSWPGVQAAAGMTAPGWPGPMMPGASSMPAQGGWPDWWAGAATAALGPDWLRAEPGTSGASPQSPAANETSARGVSAPVRGASTRRRGGHTPRPPRPAATATPPPPVDVDLTDTSGADWCDDNTRVACEIMADEVVKGNRANTHLSKIGYKNLIERFKQRTGLEYTRLQFKNKWDKLKSDYSIWKQLKNCETGIGWDESHKNIVMSEYWWKKTAKAIKGSTRFKLRGLQNEDQLRTMFEDLRNTGDEHWSASSGIAPSPIPVDEDDEGANDDDSDPEEVTPTTVPASKRSRGASNIKGKKSKTATGQWFQEQMGKLVEMNERTTASCESIANKEDTSRCSIENVMSLVRDCGALPSTNEYFIATIVFTQRSERQMFMTMQTHEERLDWLKRKYEWMTRNDVSK
ncbi:unnamed protein product [Urochloa decumbens]|uniref:Myb/SANT-like domain-containing protein n=1 Tax=Urochloa decumbens TaxID=240449 RepID=A0ABC9E4Q1_9POAL